jgi:hypothetical protein
MPSLVSVLAYLHTGLVSVLTCLSAAPAVKELLVVCLDFPFDAVRVGNFQCSMPPLVSVLARRPPGGEGTLEKKLRNCCAKIILNAKVAILELVAACVEHQPGLTQLLLDINPGVSLVVEPAPVLPAQLAGKRNCEHFSFAPSQNIFVSSVLRIHGIFVRIRIRGSIPL